MKSAGLDWAREHLGWPTPEVVLDPPGAGLGVIRELARKKIQARILGLPGGSGMRIGVLANDFGSTDTQPLLAIVCDFPRAVPSATLHELHRLAWNFSHAPALVVSEPHRLRLFTCCEPPEKEVTATLEAELIEEGIDFAQATGEAATSALHWINLAEGALARRYPDRFLHDRRADETLLSILKAVRDRLTQDDSEQPALATDRVHDLLARLIFVQFLFQRQDSQGHSALDEAFLLRLHKEGRLQGRHTDLASVLRDHEDTYALFRFLDERFNGDLFPGKDWPMDQRDRAWAEEMAEVRQAHLDFLADFVAGKLCIRSGQFALWPLYAFDVIPLEFVSSIYEAFVHKRKGTVYTPVPLVDFLLDGVLPWEGEDWNLRILDPACGSGVFLVRAFQRLVHRWRRVHPGQEPDGELLTGLLEHNLYGVDIDSAAVRVASFSLYLALCDELDPRSYWEQIRLPCLRGRRLIPGDFFDETLPGLSTETDAGGYDLVVGNPPWGKNSTSSAAKRWAEDYGWKASYGDIGPLFVAKSARLLGTTGQYSLLQPARTWLWGTSKPSRQLHRQLLESLAIEEIVNLTALRFGLFVKAVGPAVMVTGTPSAPSMDATLSYLAVKPDRGSDDEYDFEINTYDVHEVHLSDALADPLLWTTLTWGGPRDRLLRSKLQRMDKITTWVDARLGVIRGDRKKEQHAIVGRHYLNVKDWPSDASLPLESAALPVNEDPKTDSKASTDWTCFAAPQAIIRKSWNKRTGRIQAVRIHGDGIICSDSFISLCGKDGNVSAVDATVLAINSKLATYFQLLTSGRFAMERPSPLVEELLATPCPEPRPGLLTDARNYDEIDRLARDAYALSESEWALIEDLFEYTLPFFKGGETATPRRPTERGEGSALLVYGRWLIDSLRATFGERREWSVRVFEEGNHERLPVRLVALHLGPAVDPGAVRTTPLESQALADELLRLQHKLTSRDGPAGFVYRRILRVYDSVEGVPTVFIAKPDEARFWTRSMAMRDADEILADLVATQWSGTDA